MSLLASDTDDSDTPSYLSKAIYGSIFLAVVLYFFPWAIPFEVFSFWNTHGSVGDWLYAAIPWFIWAVVGTIIVCIIEYRQSGWVEKIFGFGFSEGFVVSLWAGVVEEICFRWILFLNAIISVKIANYLFFDCLGFGIPQWFQTSVAGPVANFFTSGFLPQLTPYLIDPVNWAVGGAILSANALFRDGHKYQGFIGVLSNWFFGMFLFWVLFTFGLPACILIHFLYDIIIFTLVTAIHHLTRKFG